MTLYVASKICAWNKHLGQYRKFVVAQLTTYYIHVEAVSNGGRNERQRTLGILHDVVEDRVKIRMKALVKEAKAAGIERKTTREEEEALIRDELNLLIKELRPFSGSDIVYLKDDLNALTKRSYEKGDNYMRYVRRIAAFALSRLNSEPDTCYDVIVTKVLDLIDNSLASSNPNMAEPKREKIESIEDFRKRVEQHKKDKERLGRYEVAVIFLLNFLRENFPQSRETANYLTDRYNKADLALRKETVRQGEVITIRDWKGRPRIPPKYHRQQGKLLSRLEIAG